MKRINFRKNNKLRRKVISTIAIVIICVLPALSSSLIYGEIGQEYKVQEAIKGLYMEGKKLSMGINNIFSDIDKEIGIVCQENDINNLEKDSLERMLGYIKNVRGDVVIDITVIDNKYNYIYGYNFKRQELSNKEEIKIALAGKVWISDV